MKKVITSFTAFLFCIASYGGYTTQSFTFDGVQRQYLLYVPNMYDSSQPVPFILLLHGLGDNMNNFKGVGLDKVADTANFIFAVPQALVDNVLTGSAAWNSGAGQFGITLNPNVNDVGFLNAIMDSTAAAYNIDQTKVFSTGFSMGAFMSNRLACELNNRIAAIASVSGTIGNGITCTPSRAVPVAHFHGTADATISYTANPYGNNPEALVSFWAANNGCDTNNIIIDTFPNIANDGKEVVHYKYDNGKYNTKVELFKVIGGQHEWLGPANDINYVVEIWKFFRQFQWTAQINSVETVNGNEPEISCFPNPAANSLTIKTNQSFPEHTEVRLLDLNGKVCVADFTKQESNLLQINTSLLGKGIYVLEMNLNGKKSFRKVVLGE